MKITIYLYKYKIMEKLMSIYTVAQLNDDLLANQFLMIVPPFPGSLDTIGNNVRITNFTIPERIVNTYTINYRTQKFPKPSGKDGSPNQFTFGIRIDKTLQVYKGFSDWQRLILDPVTGVQLPDFANGVSGIRIPITVLTIDSNEVPTSTGWIFDGCFPSTIPGIDFTMETGDPIVVNITMEFITVNPLA